MDEKHSFVFHLVLIILISISCFPKKDNAIDTRTTDRVHDSVEQVYSSPQNALENSNEHEPIEEYPIKLWKGSEETAQLQELWNLLDRIAETDTSIPIDESTVHEICNINIDNLAVCETRSWYAGETEKYSNFFSSSFLRALLKNDHRFSFPMLRLIHTMYHEYIPLSEYIKSLLFANLYLKEFNGFIGIAVTERNRSIRPGSDNYQGPGLIERLFMLNERLGIFVNNHASAIDFWVDRFFDSTAVDMESILAKVVKQRYPDLIDSLEKERTELTGSKNIQQTTPQLVFFNLKTFSDLTYPPAPSAFDKREQLIKWYFKQADSALTHDTVTIAGNELLDHLMSSGSRFFDRRLDCFVFSGDTSRGYTWKKCIMSPTLTLYGCAWDDGISSLGIRISPLQGDCSFNPILFAGIPQDDVKQKRIPSGCHISKLLSRTIHTPDSGRLINTVTKVWTVPPEEKHIRKIFSIDGYYYVADDDNYTAPNGIDITGQDNDGIVHQGDSLHYIVQKSSILFAVLQSGDTTVLCTDTATGGYGDGVLCLHAARFYNPIFTDINGDDRKDLFIQNSTGSVMIKQKENGKFSIHRF